ncbi:MAG: alpha/beta family hydrolase [Candidatus Korobacteraceae bacterium]
MTIREAQPFVDTASGEAPVRGFLHHAENSPADFLVLTHGAGGNCRGPLLVALGEKLSSAGVSVLRCDLPFRQRRPQGPPSPSDSKRDQEGLRRAVELMKKQFSGRAFLGGSSYGGRQATMLVVEEASLADGLLLLSYPLHPPGRPAQLRTAHFPELRTRALFISGTRDAFGTIEELEDALKPIPVATKLVPIEGAAHGLLQKSNRDDLPEAIVREFLGFFDHL